jgi:hypothetical protein
MFWADGWLACERNEILEFVDVGEYGGALWTAVGIYVEEKKIPSMNEIELINQLALAMLMDPSTMLDSLRAIE